jgi:Tol biopolymer transport system component
VESGESGVFVQPIGRQGVRVRVWTGAVNGRPVWARDGRRLYFASGRQIMQAAVHPGETFASEPPPTVFTLDRDISTFDVSPDGQRFLVMRSPEPGYTRFRVLVNWQAAMK